MKRVLAAVLVLLFILPGCGLIDSSKDDLSEQPVIEETDIDSEDEPVQDVSDSTDTQAHDQIDIEKTADFDEEDDTAPLPEDIQQLDDDASLAEEENEEESTTGKEKAKETQEKPLPYRIQIDVTNQVVTVFGRDKNGKYTKVVRQMICSTGTDATPTPLGTFTMPGHKGRWGYFAKFGVYAQYWSRIKGGILFHSVIFRKPDESTLSVSSFLNLGRKASHGCVRLLVEDAKWIYYNIPAGTKVDVVKGKKNPALTASLKPRLKPVKIEIQTSNPAELLVGETKNINVRVTYQYGVVEQNPSDITWTVSNKQVASVKNGTIQALASGKAEIKASIGKLSSKPIVVNVKKPEPEIKIVRLEISPKGSPLVINMGNTQKLQLDAKLLFEDKSEKSVTSQVEWNSSNKDVATVKNGLVTAAKSGEAIISAKYKEGEKEYVAEVKIKSIKKEQTEPPEPKEPDAIIIKAPNSSGEILNIKVGNSVSLEAQLKYSDGTLETIKSGLTWSTNNTKVIYVENGTVKGIAPGEAIVTVNYKNLTGTYKIKVEAEQTEPPKPEEPDDPKESEEPGEQQGKQQENSPDGVDA